MKKIFLVLSLIFSLCACQRKISDYDYPLEKLESFIQTDKIYTNNSQISYPENVKAKEDFPYEKSDLRALDYNKEVCLSDIYFRIPERCELFYKDSSYFIDFPFSPSYDLIIRFKDFKKFLSLDLIDLSEKLIKEEDLGELISKPVRNKLGSIESAYFISKKGNSSYTHFFLKSETGLVYFTIKEDIEKSKASKFIMADIMMTAYPPGEDPVEVKKSFDKKDISIFANKDIGVIKVPENFNLSQREENFMSFSSMKNNKLVGEIIIKKDKADNIYEAFSVNSGPIIYPTCIINMGPVLEKSYLESEVSFFMSSDTFTGKKYVFKTKDGYITIIVAGPIANESEIRMMADNIIKSFT